MGAETTAVTAAPLTPSPARLALRVLSDADVRRVHAAALELLGAAAGDAEAAARAAPESFLLAGRVPERDVRLGGAGLLLATGGPAPRVRPLGGGDPLPATAADLAGFVRLADALPEVAVVAGPPVRAAGETAIGELALCLAGTSKHVQLATLRTAAEAEAAVLAAAAVAGSEAALRERPPLSLSGGPEVWPAAEVFARAGLPTGFVLPPAGGPAAGAALAGVGCLYLAGSILCHPGLKPQNPVHLHFCWIICHHRLEYSGANGCIFRRPFWCKTCSGCSRPYDSHLWNRTGCGPLSCRNDCGYNKIFFTCLYYGRYCRDNFGRWGNVDSSKIKELKALHVEITDPS